MVLFCDRTFTLHSGGLQASHISSEFAGVLGPDKGVLARTRSKPLGHHEKPRTRKNMPGIKYPLAYSRSPNGES